MTRTFAAAIAALALTVPAVANAGAIVGGFSGETIPKEDDNSYGPAMLGFTANYFGNTFTTAHISTNGYLTFGSGQAGYTPEGLGSGYVGKPIIAGFYADIDTRNGGTTTYGSGTFEGRNAFGVTYDEVAFFGSANSPNRNSFQILLVDRADTGAANFDIVLNYDKVTWEAGTYNGSSPATGLGGLAAAIGYNAGTGNQPGTYFEFAGSRTNGAFVNGGAYALATNSNVGVNGRYVFNVRNGNVTPAPGAVPEPATWALMLLGFGAIGSALRRRQSSSLRIRYA